MPTFSQASLQKLNTTHPDLQRLFHEVIKHRDCTVLCGYRGQEEQEQAFREGKSKAHFGQSKHNQQPSRAVDVLPYPINWEDLNGIREFAGFVQGVAASMNIQISWGGKFPGFFDGPHFELKE